MRLIAIITVLSFVTFVILSNSWQVGLICFPMLVTVRHCMVIGRIGRIGRRVTSLLPPRCCHLAIATMLSSPCCRQISPQMIPNHSRPFRCFSAVVGRVGIGRISLSAESGITYVRLHNNDNLQVFAIGLAKSLFATPSMSAQFRSFLERDLVPL